jgi:SNF2 family DNA or RNA helicase
MLKQGPQGSPLIRKALVITPNSLVQNWIKEFRKWLGTERIRPAYMKDGSKASMLQVCLPACPYDISRCCCLRVA